MRPAPHPLRTRCLLAAAVLALAALAGAGCGTVDARPNVLDRTELVNTLAARLEHAGTQTYTAEYRLPGGAAATITQAQSPARTAYTFPGGKVILAPDATTSCQTIDGTTACTLTAPPAANAPANAALLTKISARGLVAPSVVVGLLTTAALNPDTQIEHRDTTVAGQHAACVKTRVADGAGFDACVTDNGVLGSFAGTVDGTTIDIVLTRYAETVTAADAFAIPPGAQITDQRTR